MQFAVIRNNVYNKYQKKQQKLDFC